MSDTTQTTHYNPLDHIKTPEQLEAYVQERIVQRYENAVDDTDAPSIHEMALRLMASGRSDIYTVADTYEYALNLHAEGLVFDEWAKQHYDEFIERYKKSAESRGKNKGIGK